MNYLNMAWHTIKKHILMFTLVLVEITMLLLAVNYIASTVNDRQMLTKPFSDILDENSAYAYDDGFFYNHGGGLSEAPSSRQKLLDALNGEYDIYDVMFCRTDGVTVISVSDELFSRLRLPLASGNRSGALGGGISAGKRTVHFEETPVEFKITGVLTDPTYVPMMSGFQSSGMTAKDFFVNSAEVESFILTDRSSIAGVEEYFIANLGFIIKFHENAEENMKLLQSSALAVSGTKIMENSAEALREDLSGFMPIFVCVFLIVIIGIISISVIVYFHNERQCGILWICGYSKKQILISHAANMLVVMAASFCVGAAVYVVLLVLGNETASSVTLGTVNIFVSVGTYMLLGALSLFIPAVKIAGQTPVKYLRRAK